MCSDITLNRILEGKPYYRALETHTITILALHEVNVNRKLESLSTDQQRNFSNRLACLNKYVSTMANDTISNEQEKIDNLLQFWKKITDVVGDSFFCVLTEHPSNTEIFLSNYINQFQCILTFIRATRENNVILHLEATRALLKYFFSNNNLSYARLLSLMEEVKQNQPSIWNEFL
jgi:hypothetical protein